jgi:hypothetical protein
MVHALPILAPLDVRRGSAFNRAGDPTLSPGFNTKWDTFEILSTYIKEIIDNLRRPQKGKSDGKHNIFNHFQ